MSTKSRGSITAALMLSLAACATEEAPTEPELAAGPTTSLRYTVRDLGTLGGSYSYAFGINRDGAAVGVSATSDGLEHAFLWRDGTLTDLGVLADGGSSGARAINRSGDVVGSSTSVDGPVHAVLWSQGGMTDLGTLDGFGQSGANSINDVGQVVGFSDDAQTGNSHAALWQNGAATDLGTLGGAYSQAYDINNSGQVVGDTRVASEDWHAFLWQNGVMTDLGTLGGAASHAQGINDDGDVVGWSENADGITHAVQWTQGAIIDLGPFDGAPGFVMAINIHDLKVGFVGSGSRTVPAGPAVFDRRKPTLLPTLGGTGGEADDVNDAGQVAGASATSAENPHAVIWVPNHG